ncbi:MAG: site-2 protease family protein [Candidatus Omnitrophica bacterium]|nr:site-2 protease family protein [Candidatus Omnitrophota bacterium]
MGLLSLFFQSPLVFVILTTLLLYSVIFHEVAHGTAALLFGDETAYRDGRLSLNPAVHIDPIGALMVLLVGFGWAKPVPVNYGVLRDSRFARVAVALSGCAVNFFIAVLSFAALRFMTLNPVMIKVLEIVIRINIILGLFNLLPLPPLDGSRVLFTFLPASAQRVFARIEPFSFFILIFLLATGILDPVISLAEAVVRSAVGVS